MAKMDPLFEEIFKEEWPEDFEQTVAKRNILEKRKSARLNQASAVKVSVVPNVLIRIMAATAVMLIGAVIYVGFFMNQTDIPSGSPSAGKSSNNSSNVVTDFVKNSYLGNSLDEISKTIGKYN